MAVLSYAVVHVSTLLKAIFCSYFYSYPIPQSSAGFASDMKRNVHIYIYIYIRAKFMKVTKEKKE